MTVTDIYTYKHTYIQTLGDLGVKISCLAFRLGNYDYQNLHLILYIQCVQKAATSWPAVDICICFKFTVSVQTDCVAATYSEELQEMCSQSYRVSMQALTDVCNVKLSAKFQRMYTMCIGNACPLSCCPKLHYARSMS